MDIAYQEDITYKANNFTAQRLPRGEYESCTFINCVFTSSDLSGIVFSECYFENSDLSMANIYQTSFKNVKFHDCKLLGLHFNKCDKFLLSITFENCSVNFSSFYQVPLKKGIFKNCKLEEVDFSESNLTQALFDNCDLKRAVFHKTILQAADLRSSYNFSINPETNTIKKAKFSTQNIAGLLDTYNIVIE